MPLKRVAWGLCMMLNSADECRRKADECRRNAGQVGDDVLRGTYLDLARRWRMMAHQAELLGETKKQAAWLGVAKLTIAPLRITLGHREN
jgi:hypothetical protein